MSGPNNAKRAQWAENALDVFILEVFSGPTETLHPEDLKDAVSDLIADLLHYARLNDMDVEAILRQSRGNFEEEVAEEETNNAESVTCSNPTPKVL